MSVPAADLAGLISYNVSDRTFALLPSPPPTFFSHAARNSTRLLLPLASLVAANGTSATGFHSDARGGLARYHGPPLDEVEGLRRYLFETVNFRIEAWQLYFLK